MKKLKRIGWAAILSLLIGTVSEAEAKKYEFSVKAGLNIGGAANLTSLR